MVESSLLIPIAMISAKQSMMGPLIAMRITIWYAFCTLVMSVVRRVTRLEGEKRSILEKENSCMWWNISFLKFRAIPAEALAAFVPARIPNTRAIMDITKSTAPIFRM